MGVLLRAKRRGMQVTKHLIWNGVREEWTAKCFIGRPDPFLLGMMMNRKKKWDVHRTIFVHFCFGSVWLILFIYFHFSIFGSMLFLFQAVSAGKSGFPSSSRLSQTLPRATFLLSYTKDSASSPWAGKARFCPDPSCCFGVYHQVWGWHNTLFYLCSCAGTPTIAHSIPFWSGLSPITVPNSRSPQ